MKITMPQIDYRSNDYTFSQADRVFNERIESLSECDLDRSELNDVVVYRSLDYTVPRKGWHGTRGLTMRLPTFRKSAKREVCTIYPMSQLKQI